MKMGGTPTAHLPLSIPKGLAFEKLLVFVDLTATPAQQHRTGSTAEQ